MNPIFHEFILKMQKKTVYITVSSKILLFTEPMVCQEFFPFCVQFFVFPHFPIFFFSLYYLVYHTFVFNLPIKQSISFTFSLEASYDFFVVLFAGLDLLHNYHLETFSVFQYFILQFPESHIFFFVSLE